MRSTAARRGRRPAGAGSAAREPSRLPVYVSSPRGTGRREFCTSGARVICPEEHMKPYRPLLLTFVLAVMAVSASGATFVVRSDRDLVDRADAVVIASALTSYTRLTSAGGVETVTPMSIEETIKGTLPSTADVVEPGGAYKRQVMIVPGSPQFAEGQRMLLFLMSTGPDRWSVLDLVVGKFTF